MSNVTPESFEDFERLALLGNVVPVVRTVTGHSSPVDIFQHLAGNDPYAFLFESVEGSGNLAEHSFIGFEPHMIVRGRGGVTKIETAGGVETLDVAAPDFLSDYFHKRTLAPARGLPPLAGGAVGFLSFQATKWFEPAFRGANRPACDDAVWMFYQTVVVIDRRRAITQIISVVFTEEATGDRSALKNLFEAAVEKTATYEGALKNPVTPAQRNGKSNAPAPGFVSNWERQSFEAAVSKVKEHILAGDCYQVVISQCFQRRTTAPPMAIYRALRETNPSPFMFFLRLGEETIAGASPEMLVRCRGRELQYRPIAGTRARSKNSTEDHRLSQELRHDEKEIAEHVMLVDLGRNDLGRVAEYGSVKVEELMAVERYSHVQHLVSRLSARLREGLDRFDALAACFPAGTVTGAPKVKAMEIIQQLEPTPRGVYSGAIVYADYAGNLDSCIAIRMLTLKGRGEASVQAGAGIVADSVPSLEYEESVNKARALFRAVEIAEQGTVNSEQQTVNSKQ